ncbi:MAG: hypothetical protein KGL39_50425 [Patescibacteria group bacterium]|nr:hypothetical protein [Patescibacteria group bacterium]
MDKAMTQTPFNAIASKSIPNGTKFVAFYYDGSGAALFWIDDSGHLYDAEAEEISATPDTHLLDSEFGYWMKLPDGYKFWFEQCEEKRP